MISQKRLYLLGLLIIMVTALGIIMLIAQGEIASPLPTEAPIIGLTGSELPDITQISIEPHEAERHLHNNNTLVIDTRPYDAWKNNPHIPGSISLPWNEFEARALNEIQPERNILLVCEQAEICTQAATWLMAHGYEQVHSIEGGLSAWIDSGLPICEDC